MNNIQIHKVAPQRAFFWISRSWEIFKQQSGLWMLSFFFIFMLGGIASSLGPVGVIAYSLTYPFLLAGFYHMAFRADNGLESRFNDLFVAFSDARVRRVLIQLGAMGLLFISLLSPLQAQLQEALIKGEVVDGNVLLMYTGAHIIYYMFFLFAVPVAHFYHEQNFLVVVKTAFLACLNNPLPMVLFALLAMTLGMATIITLFLAMVVVVPMLMISVYLAFNDILRPEHTLEDKDKDDDDNDNDDDYKIVV